MKSALLWTNQRLFTAILSQYSSFGGLYTPQRLRGTLGKQALKGRSTKRTANLQLPHLLKGRAGRDDVVLSYLLLLWLALPLMQDVLSFHFLLQQPSAAVSTTGLLPYVQPDHG